MDIIIIGCGKVGYTIAENLSIEKGVNVTIIDKNQSAFVKASEKIDALLLRGNGLNESILTEAGVSQADLVISVTDADEINILCCISAKRLGAKHTIARVRNTEYTLDMNSFWKDLGLDMTINPEQATAREISRLLRFPSAQNLDTFVSGRVELVSFRVAGAYDFFVGKSVARVFNPKKMNILLAMIERENEPLVPNGAMVFERRDVIRVLGRPSDIMNFFAMMGKNTDPIRDVTIVGASKITHYLVTLLDRHSANTEIKIIELDKDKCERLSETFPQHLVINGDGADEEILSSSIVNHDGAMICLTDRDEENAVIALYSVQLKLRKVIFKIDHINQNMVRDLGIGSIVSPRNITSNHIMRYVRGLRNVRGIGIMSIYRIFNQGENKVEAIEFSVDKKAKCKCTDIALKDMKLKKGVLIGCIVRDSSIIIPSGESVIRKGDSVIVVIKNGNVTELDDILA